MKRPFMLVTCDTSQPASGVRSTRAMVPVPVASDVPRSVAHANMNVMFSAEDVSQPERGERSVREMHAWNIELISVTLDTSHPESCEMSESELQKLNRSLMFVTFDVSHPERPYTFFRDP